MEIHHISVSFIGDIKIDNLSRYFNSLEEIFSFPIKMGQKYEIPSYAFEPKRQQYYAHKIISELLTTTPDDAVKVLGITDVDLCTPVLEYVFGAAQLNGRVAITSCYRLRQKFYHLPDDDGLFYLRLKKIIIHELGHCFGMVHCDDLNCVMYLSNNIFTLDNKRDNFCLRCSNFIKERLKKEYYGKT